MKYTLKQYPDLKTLSQTMPLDEALQKIVCPHISPESGDAVRTSASAFLFPGSAENCRTMSQKINDNRKEKALIVSDMEFGAGNVITGATPFPSMRAAAVAGSAADAYEMGAIAAKEARTAGFQWTFGPCVDIIGYHNNPIVSNRCSGDTAEDNITFGGAYLRGLQDNGLIATLKHFPGDGFCEHDQHITVGVNPLPYDEWKSTFGHVYQSLIDEGAKAIMAGHISLPGYDDYDEELQMFPPATLSEKIMTKLLRQELGFAGILISDATNMGGFAGCMNIYRASARFLMRGGDCLLFQYADEEFLAQMHQSLQSGELSEEVVRDRAYRMMCFSRQYYEECPPVQAPDRAQSETVAQRMVDHACTIARDREHILPVHITKDTRILHVVVVTDAYPKDAPAAMTSALREYSDHVEEMIDPGPWALKDRIKENQHDLVVCTIGTQLSMGYDSVCLHGAVARNMMEGWMHYGIPVVFVNFGHPYLMDDYPGAIGTIINTYGYTPMSPQAVMRRLCAQ